MTRPTHDVPPFSPRSVPKKRAIVGLATDDWFGALVMDYGRLLTYGLHSAAELSQVARQGNGILNTRCLLGLVLTIVSVVESAAASTTVALPGCEFTVAMPREPTRSSMQGAPSARSDFAKESSVEAVCIPVPNLEMASQKQREAEVANVAINFIEGGRLDEAKVRPIQRDDDHAELRFRGVLAKRLGVLGVAVGGKRTIILVWVTAPTKTFDPRAANEVLGSVRLAPESR